jgi:putative colanic acid biosynthesis glycosyltransferase
MHEIDYDDNENNVNYKPMLSIITAVKNDYQRLLKTVLSLSYIYNDVNFEHIIIDGASTDSTTDLLEVLRFNSNVKVVSERDSGIYDAMNKGIYLSNGSYLLFLNAGDRLAADKEQIIKWIKLLRDRSTTSIACFPALISNGNSMVPLIPISPILHKMPTSHQAILFSKKFITNHLYDTNLKIAGDFDVYLRALKENILIFRYENFLTEIELEGYASRNPLLAYKEYIMIIWRRLYGLDRVVVLIRIMTWACFIILAKKALPKKIFSLLRGA